MSEVPLYQRHAQCRSASEREGNNLNGFKGFRTENGSSQGHNLALKSYLSYVDSTAVLTCAVALLYDPQA